MCMILISSIVSTVESIKIDAIKPMVLNPSPSNIAVIWTEIQKLLPLDGTVSDFFGYSASLDGDTAIVGAVDDDDKGINSGAAYIFIRTNNNWIQEAKLLASDGAAEDLFGSSVSLSSDTALIGAVNDDDNGDQSGSVYVFVRMGSNWTQQAKLLVLDSAAEDQFGYSLSLDGDTALIGAANDDDNGVQSGSAYVFTRTGSNWTQEAKLLASDGTINDFFGSSVCVSSSDILIGAHGDDDNGNQSGSAYVFTRTGSNWTQQAKLLAPGGAAGDYFGWSVSLSGNSAFIGADGDDDQGESSGSAYVFTRTGSSWTHQAKLLAPNGTAYDSFGWCISLSGDTALIGAPFDDDNGDQSGSAYVFTRTGSNWTQQAKLLPSDGTVADRFGWRLSLSNDTALFGVKWDRDNGIDSGSAYVFAKKSINQSPEFGTPTPINGSTNNLNSFTWSIPINDSEGDIFSWTIQCNNGQVNNEISAINGTKSLSLLGLAYSTTYTIWVNATDTNGSGLYTRNWYTFTTKANQPPGLPSITGSITGKVGRVTCYNFTSIDPEGDRVYYFIDWGDFTNSSWIGSYLSGDKIIISHTWIIKGTYTVKAKAKDIYGKESSWAQFELTMPKGTIYIPAFILELIEKFMERFPFVFQIFRPLLG